MCILIALIDLNEAMNDVNSEKVIKIWPGSLIPGTLKKNQLFLFCHRNRKMEADKLLKIIFLKNIVLQLKMLQKSALQMQFQG